MLTKCYNNQLICHSLDTFNQVDDTITFQLISRNRFKSFPERFIKLHIFHNDY